MELGMVGLGRMGANMTTRLLAGGHRVVAHDRAAEPLARAKAGGAVPADSLDALVADVIATKATERLFETDTVALFARLSQQDVTYSASHRVHTRSSCVEGVCKREGSQIRHAHDQ